MENEKTKVIKLFLTDEQLKSVARVVADRVALNTKEVLNFDEACTYAGLSKSAMYKQTMQGNVPHYKPTGKCVYFNRQELENWLLSNRCATNAELTDKAKDYCTKHKMPGPKVERNINPKWRTTSIPLNILVMITKDFQTAELRVLTDKYQAKKYIGWFPIPTK